MQVYYLFIHTRSTRISCHILTCFVSCSWYILYKRLKAVCVCCKIDFAVYSFSCQVNCSHTLQSKLMYLSTRVKGERWPSTFSWKTRLQSVNKHRENSAWLLGFDSCFVSQANEICTLEQTQLVLVLLFFRWTLLNFLDKNTDGFSHKF